MQTLMHSTGQPIGTQVSFSNLDSNVVLVTGNQTYKYYIHRDGNLIFQNKQISKKDYNMISQNYTAHCWLPEGKILVGTDQGQILLCDPNGEIKRPISTGSDFYIEKFLTYSKGFIIVGDKGRMKVFVNTGEPNNPYQEVASLPDPEAEEKMTEEQKEILRNLQSSRIKSLDLDSAEENLIFTTENNQLYRIGISLLDNKNIEAMYEYLVHPFHSRQISGMDVCIKKNLVVTCSADKTVKIWQYNQSTGELELQINQMFPEDALCVAFHPSGFHIVVGFFDKIQMMNVFKNSVEPYPTDNGGKEINVKQCREIVFSHGGHLFACQNQTFI